MKEFQLNSCLVAIQAFSDPKDEHSRCTQYEEVADSKKAAVALLDRMIGEERENGMTVTFAAAHSFVCEDDGLVVAIESFYRVFQIQEPHSDSTREGVGVHFENPNAEWHARTTADVAGTDPDGDGWFLRYHVVEVGEYWPEDTINEPLLPR